MMLTNGNGYRSGGVGISVHCAYLVAGKSKKEELFAKMQDGLYTELKVCMLGLIPSGQLLLTGQWLCD